MITTIESKSFYKSILYCATVISLIFSAANAFCLETYLLKDLDLTQCVEVKRATASIWLCNHIVYRSKNAEFYYKIWGLPENLETPNYIKRCQDFLAAFNAGIFDEISPLHGLIFDENLCCGYITKRCNSVNANTIKWADHGAGRRLLLVENQPFQVMLFWKKLLRVYEETSYKFIDMQLDNLGEIKKKYVLVDLDDFFRERDIEGTHVASWIPIGLEMYRFYKKILS